MCDRQQISPFYEFMRLTEGAVPNSDQSRFAQRFFKTRYMGLDEQGDRSALHTFPVVPATERGRLQQAFYDGLARLHADVVGLHKLSGSESVKSLMEPLSDEMRHTVHKVGLELGMTSPR
jgi:hypothetical protein